MTVKEDKQFIYKRPIITLLLFSVICSILSGLEYFLYYDSHILFYNSSYNRLAFEIPSFFDFISLFMEFTPCVLLFLYVIKFHSQEKASLIYSIACGLIATHRIFYIILDIIKYGFKNNFKNNIVDFIFDLIIAISFILLTLNALKGLTQKIYTVIASLAGLSIELYSLIPLLRISEALIEASMFLTLFTWSMYIIFHATLYLSLLLFGLKNEIPPIIKKSHNKQITKFKTVSPEESLRLLKDKFESGIISEEEYKAQKADIIKKL